METKVKDIICDECIELIKESEENPTPWYFYRFKDYIYMVECKDCRNVLVWKLICCYIIKYDNNLARSKFIKIISYDDPEYIIWKLKQ